MPERDVDINLDPTSSASDLISPEDQALNDKMAAQIARAELKKRTVEIYERGVVADRLHVDLPPDLVGEWVPNTPTDIARKESLGFTLDATYAPKRRLHDKGDSYSYVGDVVHMTAPKIVREVIDEVKRERYQLAHGKGKKQKEEKDFEKQNETLSSAGIATNVDSNVARVDSIEQIRSALKPNPGS